MITVYDHHNKISDMFGGLLREQLIIIDSSKNHEDIVIKQLRARLKEKGILHKLTSFRAHIRDLDLATVAFLDDGSSAPQGG